METIANQSRLLPLSAKYTVRNNFRQKSQTLVINNAQWRDVGVYKCVAAINGTLVEDETSLDILSELQILSTLLQMQLLCNFVQFL